MKTFILVVAFVFAAGFAYACCGDTWTAPPPPPPPDPGQGGSTPDLDYIPSENYGQNVYDITRTSTKQWIRPSTISNEFGIYTFSNIDGKTYYKVETSNGAIFMSRY